MTEDRRQAGASVLVTPEMLRVGLEVLWHFDRDADDPEEFLREVYVAMAQVSSRSPS